MAFATWTEDLSVGVVEIDDQHRRLLMVINDLHEAVMSGKGRAVSEALFEELANYITDNFGTEEKLMEANGYPQYESHRRAHGGFTERVRGLRAKCFDDPACASADALGYLKDWIINHDVLIDKDLGVFLNARGIH
ncbi:MAG TPA: bacteriohemerythrin [bacterium]|nr:bacteriohemerythrin [bacterium]